MFTVIIDHSCVLLFFAGHQEKANVLAFHPQAEGLLASAGYDGKLLLWDLASHCVVKEMEGLPHPVCSLH